MLRREIWKTSVSNDVREVKTLIYNFDNVKLEGDMTNNKKIELAEKICSALFGSDFLTNDATSGDDTIDRVGYVTMNTAGGELREPVRLTGAAHDCFTLQWMHNKPLCFFNNKQMEAFLTGVMHVVVPGFLVTDSFSDDRLVIFVEPSEG